MIVKYNYKYFSYDSSLENYSLHSAKLSTLFLANETTCIKYLMYQALYFGIVIPALANDIGLHLYYIL